MNRKPFVVPRSAPETSFTTPARKSSALVSTTSYRRLRRVLPSQHGLHGARQGATEASTAASTSGSSGKSRASIGIGRNECSTTPPVAGTVRSRRAQEGPRRSGLHNDDLAFERRRRVPSFPGRRRRAPARSGARPLLRPATRERSRARHHLGGSSPRSSSGGRSSSASSSSSRPVFADLQAMGSHDVYELVTPVVPAPLVPVCLRPTGRPALRESAVRRRSLREQENPHAAEKAACGFRSGAQLTMQPPKFSSNSSRLEALVAVSVTRTDIGILPVGASHDVGAK